MRGDFNDVPFLLPSHPGGVNDVTISPDARLVATAGADRVARIYPLRPVVCGKFCEMPRAGDVKGGGELALLSEADAALPAYRDYFLKEQPANTKGLIHRLKPETFYLSARWDYAFTPACPPPRHQSPRPRPRQIRPADRRLGGSSARRLEPAHLQQSRPRSFPGHIKALDLQPDQSVEMELPLIPPARSAAEAVSLPAKE